MIPHIQHHLLLQSIVTKHPFKIIEVDYFSFLPLDPVTRHRYNISFNYKKITVLFKYSLIITDHFTSFT
jgi:hypothetical protein